MPAKISFVSPNSKKLLRFLGQQLRDRRKEQKLSATLTAEAADISRVTLYRVEQGEPSVAMGAYVSVMIALGLGFEIKDAKTYAETRKAKSRKLPKKIKISDYGQLKQLAWQLKGTLEITPSEALDLYERNIRHVDFDKLEKKEQNLINDLLAEFGRERLLV